MGNSHDRPQHNGTDNDVQGITLVTSKSHNQLNQRQVLDYRAHRREWVRWLLTLGKDPDHGNGYAHATARRRACDTDVFYRWVWTERGGYTLDIDHDDADDYCQHLALSEYSDTHRANIQKSLKTLFRWRRDSDPYDPQITFGGAQTTRQPKEYLTREERTAIEEAALEYGTVPSPDHLHGEDYQQWCDHLAMRFRKPATDVTDADFRRANGFKIPSLVYTSLDCGLRPAEVGAARVSWVDVANERLRIPAEDAVKNRDNWQIPIRTQTARYLDQWLAERQCYDRYDDTDTLWLTRENNPYGTRSLKYVLRKLCDVAGIDTEDRQMTWYAIRHSTGTMMAREEGLEGAAAQLRHSSTRTTRKYDHAPLDDRRDALERF